MECRALNDPASLAQLIADLEDVPTRPWRDAAEVCLSQSVEDPGRKRLWVVPRDPRAGANPRLWLRQHPALLDELVDRTVVHTAIIFAGRFPEVAERHWIELRERTVTARSSTREARAGRRVRRDIRAISASSHLWVDRLRVSDEDGNIDERDRDDRLLRWGGRYWTSEMEGVYIPPNFQTLDEGSEKIADTARTNLLAARPSCLESGLIVMYGHGGVGKTFFLSRLAHGLTRATSASPTASIPVFVQLAGVLHRYALENWLSRNEFGMLTLGQITCLLRHGVIVPLLDALDEVVKGEARQGSEEFLDHLVQLVAGDTSGRGVLACRDYYLTTDRSLVRGRVHGSECCAELSIGPFDQKDTRRFIQARTGLSPDHASRWADALEDQARAIVGEEEELDVIRHPVVLDTLARYIRDLPPASRMTAVDEFHLSTSDIIGQIVDELLKRERQKHAPLWEETFSGRLQSESMDPFNPEKQRMVLRQLTLLVASDGTSQSSDEPNRREFRHGVFLSTRGVPETDSPREALEALLCQILDPPQVAASVAEKERPGIQSMAAKHLGEAYGGHILASTEPNRPHDLVFALRHRFYFDYFLADALLTEIQRAMMTGHGDELMDWCLDHHVGGPFDGCLDFLAWDPRVGREGVERLRQFFKSGQEVDDVLASYLLSLSLAVFLRRRVPGRARAIDFAQFAPARDIEFVLAREFLPEELSDFSVHSCSFPVVTLDSFDVTNVTVESCDFQSLRIIGSPRSRISRCHLIDVECELLTFDGTIALSETELDVEGDIVVGEGARVELYNCALGERVERSLEEARAAGADIIIKSPKPLERLPSFVTTQSPGRRFVSRLMSLLRKEGHTEFAVYMYKLRDRTPGTDPQFSEALEVLQRRGVVYVIGPMVLMTPQGAAEMYQPRLFNKPDYDPHDDCWKPIIEELDEVLT